MISSQDSSNTVTVKPAEITLDDDEIMIIE